MDGELVVFIRLATEGGSFVLLCVIVLWMLFRGAPQHFKNQLETQEVLRQTLLDQRRAHAEERQYIRNIQEQQHRDNIDAIGRLSRAVSQEKTKRPDARY